MIIYLLGVGKRLMALIWTIRKVEKRSFFWFGPGPCSGPRVFLQRFFVENPFKFSSIQLGSVFYVMNI